MKFERNVESIAFAYETDAIDTLVHLKDIIKAYGRVTVKDLMDLVGMTPTQRGENEPATQAATLATRRRNPDRGGSGRGKTSSKGARPATPPASSSRRRK